MERDDVASQERAARPDRDAGGIPLFSVVQPDAVMKSKEKDPANAVLAIDISPATASPCIRDIYAAVEKQFGTLAKPTGITLFCTDFIVQFATARERDLVLSSELLYGRSFNMILIPWSKSYRSRTVCWQTEVAVDIGSLPVHACYDHCLQPLLSPYCRIKPVASTSAKAHAVFARA